jgi:multisubunit Na+/H+ antiporter MnhB subunit
MKKILPWVIAIGLSFIMVMAVLEMPQSCCVDAPAYSEVSQYYLDNAVEDTGATNVISAILADYRLFDTLGETIVLFASIVAVVSTLRKKKEDAHHA